MFKNYLKIAARNLIKHKTFSTINITGLAIGLAACLLIFQYIQYEYSFDKFWRDSDNIYRIGYNRYQNDELSLESARSLNGVGPAISQEIPEITGYVQMHRDVVTLYNDETQIQDIQMFATDSMFSSVFKLDFVMGQPDKPLRNLFSAVISQSAATRLFGSENPIGKWFKVNEGWEFIVTGVFADLPENTHMPFDLLLSFQTYQYYNRNWDYTTGGVIVRDPDAHINTNPVTRWNWGWNGCYTYILTRPDSDPKAIETKIAQISKKYTQRIIQNGGKTSFYLQPLRSIHLTSDLEYEIKTNGNRMSVIALTVIALILLCIAWINFVNLSMVRYIERRKETGIRKVVGAFRYQLIQQFILESLLVNIIAVFVALNLVLILQSGFSLLTAKPITFSFADNSTLWIIFGVLFLLGSFISAFIPAYIQSSLKPIVLFKPKISGYGNNVLKHIFVIAQFAASIILIIGSMMVYRQVDYMKNQDLGVNIDRTLVTYSPMTMIRHPQRIDKINAYKSSVTSLTGVRSMSTSSAIPGREILWYRSDIKREGVTVNNVSSYAFAFIDHDFINTFELEILAGRNFSKNMGNESGSIIINEAAMKQLGFDSPHDAVDQFIYRRNTQIQIIGVIKNYHHQSLKHEIKPIVYFSGYRWNHNVGYYSIKINPGNIHSAVASIKDIWGAIYPEDYFHYFFLDEAFNNQYKSDQQFGKVFGVFTLLAIFIAAMGLLGLASFSAKQRTKEIGIRKTLGASVAGIIILLCANFTKLVLIANIIAWPIAYFAMRQWLDNFAYRTELSWWIFTLAGVLALGIALITVSFQAIRAARANPVESLRYE